MATVTIQLYKSHDVQGVLLHERNYTIAAWESPAKAIKEYTNTVEEYQSRKGIDWSTSLTLFRLVMEHEVGVVEVPQQEFIEMMQKRDHKVKRVGNQACPLVIADCTYEELKPYLGKCIGLATADSIKFKE